MQIRLAGIIESNANGPGLRKVIFSQGCSHKCPECFNQHTWDFNGGVYKDCDEIVSQILDDSYVAGVTFSGGDPFDQPEPFAYIAKKLKQNGLNLWSYTGYTWEQLIVLSKTNIHIKELLSQLDTLVDGPFIKARMNDNIELRGSDNQRIIDVQESLKTNTLVLDKRFR